MNEVLVNHIDIHDGRGLSGECLNDTKTKSDGNNEDLERESKKEGLALIV